MYFVFIYCWSHMYTFNCWPFRHPCFHWPLFLIAEPVRSQSLEEKRSKSLEDKPAEPKVDRHGNDNQSLTHCAYCWIIKRHTLRFLLFMNLESTLHFFKTPTVAQFTINTLHSRSLWQTLSDCPSSFGQQQKELLYQSVLPKSWDI